MKSILISLMLVLPMVSAADCEKVQGGSKSPYNGEDLGGLQVDKAALTELNKKFPALSVTTKVFTGDIKTCTGCTDNFVTCK